MIQNYFLKRIKRLFSKQALVLMYHRIADPPTDPWQLSVTAENFQLHLGLLKNNFRVIPLRQMVEQLKMGKLEDKSISITFDDGYADNYQVATPLLQQFNCPATFFIATHFTGSRQEFWWDALGSIFLETDQLPCRLELIVDGERLQFTLSNNGKMQPGEMAEHKRWNWPEDPPTGRSQIYLSLWERLKPLPFDQIVSSIGLLSRWAVDTYNPSVANFPMRAEELKNLASQSLIEIGMHTHTHPALAFHDKALQQDEIVKNKIALENMIGPMKLLAYPYGNFNNDTVEIVRELGLKGAFTTSETTVHVNSDILKLGRFQVKNWAGDSFIQHVNEWLS